MDCCFFLHVFSSTFFPTVNVAGFTFFFTCAASHTSMIRTAHPSIPARPRFDDGNSRMKKPSLVSNNENENHVQVQESGSCASTQIKEPLQSVTEWLQTQDVKQVAVRVTDPRSVAKGKRAMSLFHKTRTAFIVNYSIEDCVTSPMAARTVERDFYDFGTLRAALVRRFPGSCVPPLPSMKPSGLENKDAFNKKQARLLELFLQTCADHSFFRNDSVFEAFVNSSLPFEQTLKSTGSDPSEGTERWHQALCESTGVVNCKDALYLIDALQRELKSTEKRLGQLKTCIKTEIEKSKARAEASNHTVEALNDLLASEKSFKSVLAGKVSIEDDAISFSDAVERVVRYNANHTAALFHEYGEDQQEMAMLDNTRFELMSVTNWLEHLDAAAAIERKFQKIEGSEDVTDVNSECVNHRKGLLGVELSRFKQARVLRTLRMKDSIAEMHVQGAKAILEIWDLDAKVVTAVVAVVKPVAALVKMAVCEIPIESVEQPKLVAAAIPKPVFVTSAAQTVITAQTTTLPGPPRTVMLGAIKTANGTLKTEVKPETGVVAAIIKPTTIVALKSTVVVAQKPAIVVAAKSAVVNSATVPPNTSTKPVFALRPNTYKSAPESPWTKEKLRRFAMDVASHAAVETREVILKEMRGSGSKPTSLVAMSDLSELHTNCKSMGELVDMFWSLVYCVMGTHIFFIIVFMFRGHYREAASAFVLCFIVFAAGHMVETVHRASPGKRQ